MLKSIYTTEVKNERRDKKEKKKKSTAHTNEFCLNSTTLLTNGWKGIRINAFRICNYNQKTNLKKIDTIF